MKNLAPIDNESLNDRQKLYEIKRRRDKAEEKSIQALKEMEKKFYNKRKEYLMDFSDI